MKRFVPGVLAFSKGDYELRSSPEGGTPGCIRIERGDTAVVISRREVPRDMRGFFAWDLFVLSSRGTGWIYSSLLSLTRLPSLT